MSRKINSMYENFRRWRRYRTTARELSHLSSHELKDLGITRGDIGRLAREAARI